MTNKPVQHRKVTTRFFQDMKKRREKICALTAYDYTFARLADELDIELLLVGDSLGMTVLGYDNTIPVTLEQSLHHTAAVVRGTERAMVIADMPFLTYHLSPEQALKNAGRYLQEAGADGVKVEGGRIMADTVKRLVSAGIPVLGHIGILPQSVLAEGGYRVQGRTKDEFNELKKDAQAIAEAGAFAVVLEGIPLDRSRELTEILAIPTIGIGAGPHCDGQVQVVHDILGLFEKFVPKHTKRYADLANEIRQAMGNYRDEVKSAEFPDKDSSFE
ncbi:MAG: 3-methyl-2-oxobutanoate hydroxymethyltransferase [Lentisphaeria bacterium]